jgi:hypothetical protein
MPELRVVHATITNQSITITDRPVPFDENGASAPLTQAEFDAATSLPKWFTDAELIRNPPEFQPSAVAAVDPEAAAEALRIACLDGLGIAEGDGFLDWWNTASEADAIDLADDGCLEEAHLIALWDHEGKQFNRPHILAAIDNAIQRHRPVRTPERINQALVKQSSSTPNTKSKKDK